MAMLIWADDRRAGRLRDVPYADFNLLKFPTEAQAMEKIRDLTCLTIFCRQDSMEPSRKVGVVSTVYVAGAGPVGLAAAAAAQILARSRADRRHEQGAACPRQERLASEPIDLTRHDRLASSSPTSWALRKSMRNRLRRLSSNQAPGTDGKVVEAPCRRAEQPDGDHPGSRRNRHSRPCYVTEDRARRSRQPSMATQPTPRLGWQSPTPSTPARHQC